MCGIIAMLGRPDTKNANKILLDQYELQTGRGKQGFGLVEVKKTNFSIKRSMSEPRAIVDIMQSDAKIMLFHHRFPTSTTNLHGQTHPILVSNAKLEFDWLVMHNGVIGNDIMLKKEHENLGFLYTTIIDEEYKYSGVSYEKFNDSEAFAIELVRYLELQSDIINTQGSAAFISMKIDKISGKPLSIIIGRNDKNPLDMELKDDGILIASDIPGELKVEIPAFMAFEIAIKDITSKTSFGKLTELMPLNFAVPPVAAPIVTHSLGFHATEHNRRLKDTTLPHLNTSDMEESAIEESAIREADGLEEPMSEREEAFYKMEDRIMEDIGEEISQVFNELIIEDMDDLVIDAYADRIRDIVLSTKGRAAKCREYFEKQLENEIDAHRADMGMYNHGY